MSSIERSGLARLGRGEISRRRFLSGGVVGLSALAVARFAPPVLAQAPPLLSQPWGQTFVGPSLEDPGTLSGIVTDGSRVMAYVCADPVLPQLGGRYAQAVGGGDWFHGVALDPSNVLLQAPSGAVLSLNLTGAAPVGQVQTASGTVLTLSPDLSSATDGLYRAVPLVQGNPVVAGWILALNTQGPLNVQVGALQLFDGSALPAPALNPQNPTQPLPIPQLMITVTPAPVALLPAPTS